LVAAEADTCLAVAEVDIRLMALAAAEADTRLAVVVAEADTRLMALAAAIVLLAVPTDNPC